MPAFEISIATTRVTLDPSRHGEASFTVQNTTGRGVRALARPVGLPPTDGAWLTIVGQSERDYAVGGVEQVTVAIDVPEGVAGGDYPFRLDVVATDRPDVDFAQGPTVTCTVPEPPPPIDPPGYVETLAGAEGGGLGGMLLGAAVGIVFIFIFLAIQRIAGPPPSSGGDLGQAIAEAFVRALVEALVLVVLTVLLALGGLWAGGAVGAFLVLRGRGFKDPWRTAAALGVIFPFWAFATLVALIALLSAIDDPPGLVVLVAALLGAAIALAVPALGARAFARWRQEGHL